MTATRINARLDDDAAKKLDTLRRRTGLSTTKIVHAALHQYYASCIQAPRSPAAILRRSGFVGSASGPQDLSAEYKESLGRSLRKKIG